MNGRELQKVIDCVENEGFEYCFCSYSYFDEIKDKEFHKRCKRYVDAANELKEF